MIDVAEVHRVASRRSLWFGCLLPDRKACFLNQNSFLGEQIRILNESEVSRSFYFETACRQHAAVIGCDGGFLKFRWWQGFEHSQGFA